MAAQKDPALGKFDFTLLESAVMFYTQPVTLYLAQPYSGNEVWNFQAGCRAVRELLDRGFAPYSPIVHNHTLAERFELPGSFSYWRGFDFAMIRQLEVFVILELPGWIESRGVAFETAFAQGARKQIVHVPWTFDDTVPF